LPNPLRVCQLGSIPAPCGRAPIPRPDFSPDSRESLVDGSYCRPAPCDWGRRSSRTSVPDAFTYYHVELDSHSLIPPRRALENILDLSIRLGRQLGGTIKAAYTRENDSRGWTTAGEKRQRQVFGPVERRSLLRRAMASFGSTVFRGLDACCRGPRRRLITGGAGFHSVRRWGPHSSGRPRMWR